MNNVVADTDVVSYILKNHPFGSRYDADLVGRIPLISFMTVAEIEAGGARRCQSFLAEPDPEE